MKHWLKQVAIAVDQLLNAAIPGGWADETFSGRCWRQRHKRRWEAVRRVVDGLFFWQKGHCRVAYESEQLRRHLPPEYRPLRTEGQTT